MPSYTQDNRSMAIATPLGPNILLLEGVEGTEGISRLFNFELTLVAERHAIEFDKIIGTNVTVAMTLPSGKQRYFNGIISRFVQAVGGGGAGVDPRFSQYRATMVPWLWLLTRTADSRIFQKMKAPDIIEKIFRDQGFADFTLKLEGSYEKRDFCVQYRETDFNFVSRLMEEEGIHYYFEHTNGKHTLIIGDSPSAASPCPNQQAVRFRMNSGSTYDDDAISSIEKMQEIRPGKYTLNDFNFETPKSSLKAETLSQVHLGPGEREIYDYPGGYGKKAEGDRYSRIRMEEEESAITTIVGAGACRGFSSGFKFTLSGFYRMEMNDKEYLLISVEHHARQGVREGGDFKYDNRFSCIPATVPFRPMRTTPKPVVQGAQTAIVVGPSGEEIYVDEHGRVKVQFHWDREGKSNEESSCWVRVSQLWAGSGWGAVFIPRIGHEVIVDFLEGDPDRPIITGTVYNGANKLPYPLPAEKTKSTIKTSSSKDGGGFNEIRFEDKKDSEQLFIHGQKNLDLRIKKDALEWIGNERHLIVTKDQLEKVEGDKHLTVTGDHNEKVDGTVSLKVGMDQQQKIGMKLGVDAGQEIHLKAGMNVVIEAGMSITLKAGGGFIVVGPAGVTISGTPVLINSGGSAGSGSGASPDPPKAPKEADKAEPGKVSQTSDQSTAPAKPPPPIPATQYSPQAAALKSAAKSGAPFCDI